MKTNILIVDDDREIAQAIAFYLRNEGYEPLIALDGIEALNLIRSTSVSLIIMDVMMPGLDGIQTTLRIREEHNIPIIMLSAKSGELTVHIAPATAEAAQVVQQNLPRLEVALAGHASSFHHVAVVMASAKKGKTDETA